MNFSVKNDVVVVGTVHPTRIHSFRSGLVERYTVVDGDDLIGSAMNYQHWHVYFRYLHLIGKGITAMLAKRLTEVKWTKNLTSGG